VNDGVVAMPAAPEAGVIRVGASGEESVVKPEIAVGLLIVFEPAGSIAQALHQY
jgi:hypothetical protein